MTNKTMRDYINLIENVHQAAEGSEDLVQIEYWQQETTESGRWVKTKPIPRASAEKIIDYFERGEIVDVKQGVAEGSAEHKLGEDDLDVRKRLRAKISKYTELVIKAGNAGDLATADKYKKKIEAIKQQMPALKQAEQGVAEGSGEYCDACDRAITKKPHVCPGSHGVSEEQLEETSPEAIAKINQITRK